MVQSVSGHCAENSTDEQCACMQAAQTYETASQEYTAARQRMNEIANVELPALERSYYKTEGAVNKYKDVWDEMSNITTRKNKWQEKNQFDLTGNNDAGLRAIYGGTEKTKWHGQQCSEAYETKKNELIASGKSEEEADEETKNYFWWTAKEDWNPPVGWRIGYNEDGNCPRHGMCGYYYASSNHGAGRTGAIGWTDSAGSALGNAIRWKWRWRNGGSCNFNKRDFKYKTPEEDTRQDYIYSSETFDYDNRAANAMTDHGPPGDWYVPRGGEICTQAAINQQGVGRREELWEGPQARGRGSAACSHFFPEPCGGGKCDLRVDYPRNYREPWECKMVFDRQWESRLRCFLKGQRKGEDIETFKEELRNSEEFIADGGRTGSIEGEPGCQRPRLESHPITGEEPGGVSTCDDWHELVDEYLNLANMESPESTIACCSNSVNIGDLENADLDIGEIAQDCHQEIEQGIIQEEPDVVQDQQDVETGIDLSSGEVYEEGESPETEPESGMDTKYKVIIGIVICLVFLAIVLGIYFVL